MAIALYNKPNTIAVSVIYPYGDIKDNPGDGTGTPVNRYTNADLHQFLAKIFAESGLSYNNLPDNATNGFQYFQALQNNIFKYKSIIITFGNAVLGYDAFGSLVIPLGGGIQQLPPSVPGDNNDGRSITIYNAFNPQTFIVCSLGNVIYGSVSNSVEIGPGDTLKVTQWSVGSYFIENKFTSGSGTKVIPIGNWDMNATGTKNVAHGLTLGKIRSISALINIDTLVAVYPLAAMINLTPGGSVYMDATTIYLFAFSDVEAGNLYPAALSAFRNVQYSASPFNRGWITIEYET